MITQKQIDARDEYIKCLEKSYHNSLCRQLIAEADREAAEMQSTDEQKLALWDEAVRLIKGINDLIIKGGGIQITDLEVFIKKVASINHTFDKDDVMIFNQCEFDTCIVCDDNRRFKCSIISSNASRRYLPPPKDDTPEIKAAWDKAVERCAKGVLR